MTTLSKITNQLIKAVIANNVNEVNQLLNEGADPNYTLDPACITALHYAAQNNALHVIPLLVEAGADLNAQTEPEGYTALEIAILHNHEKVVSTLMAYSDRTDGSMQ